MLEELKLLVLRLPPGQLRQEVTPADSGELGGKLRKLRDGMAKKL